MRKRMQRYLMQFYGLIFKEDPLNWLQDAILEPEEELNAPTVPEIGVPVSVAVLVGLLFVTFRKRRA